MINQNQIFAKGEGDAWYKRNQQHLSILENLSRSEDVSFICETLMPFKNTIGSVLEVGCSNGIKLEVICESLDAVGTGIEPSANAVKSGNERGKHTDITLLVGTGEKLPFESAKFDLVYFAFCLYLFDRNTLMQSLAEADRVLKPGGFLVITDFDPGTQYRRPYSHFEGVYSYKQDYAAFYEKTGLYYMAAKKSYSHRQSYFDAVHDERVSSTVLYKEAHPYPIQL